MGGRQTWLIVALLAWAAPGRAQQQFAVVEQTYTATTANTSDSHYRVPPRQGTPGNWRSPVDYASGRVHARLEVLDKPSAEPTLYNICFEATPSYACMPYSPAYTAEGVYDFEYPFSAFYQYSDVDWSQGVRQIALILKDENGTKMQGSPAFYPTTIHLTLTVVAPGATYVPPRNPGDAGTPEDAGDPPDAGASEPDAATETDAATGAPDAGPSDPAAGAGGGASASGSGGRGGSGAAPAPTVPTVPTAGSAGSGAGVGTSAGIGSSSAAPVTAGAAAPIGGAAAAGMGGASGELSGGCSVAPARVAAASAAAPCLSVLWLAMRSLRSRRRRRGFW